MSDFSIPQIINLPAFNDPSGNLAVVEEKNHIPFKIERVYWIYDVPGGEIRGGHAFIKQKEFIIALSGSFDIVLNNGKSEQVFSLNRSHYGLYIPEMVWRTIENFSTNSLCMIITSEKYNQGDYLRDYDEFLNLKSQ